MRFDIDNLPDDVKSQLKRDFYPVNPIRERIVETLCKYGVMSVNEVLVGLWIEYQIKTTRKTVQMRLSELNDEGRIERIRRGEYGPVGGKGEVS